MKKFTDIKAWQEGRLLAIDIYEVTRKKPFANDFGFKDQIQRAAVSVNSNIAEGFERDSNPEFVKFLGYAKGSAGETLSQLITAHDIGYVGDDDFNHIAKRLSFISTLISRFRDTLVSTSYRGRRWKVSPDNESPSAESL